MTKREAMDLIEAVVDVYDNRRSDDIWHNVHNGGTLPESSGTVVACFMHPYPAIMTVPYSVEHKAFGVYDCLTTGQTSSLITYPDYWAYPDDIVPTAVKGAFEVDPF